MKKAIVILLLAVMLTGCAVETETSTAPEAVNPYVSRFIDKEAGVVCWVYSNIKQGGISCLPIEQTNLTYGE